jgi:hypothetical protein
VGSLLRAPELLRARDDCAGGKTTAEELKLERIVETGQEVWG